MTGINRMIVQQRDLHLLRELSMMRVIDREHAKTVAGFHSTTRANARLLALTRAGLLRRFFLGSGGGRKALYALSAKGAQLVQLPMRGPRRREDAMLVADFYIQHQLTVNDIYCTLKYRPHPAASAKFSRWFAFYEPIIPQVKLIPDGYIEFVTSSGVAGCFLEVDLGHESLAVWKEKARHYLQFALSGEYCKQFGQERFRIFVLVNSERRLHSIRKAVASVTQKLFWFATLESAKEKFFTSVWSRPTDDKQMPPFGEYL